LFNDNAFGVVNPPLHLFLLCGGWRSLVAQMAGIQILLNECGMADGV
jgi:hypothetical protein